MHFKATAVLSSNSLFCILHHSFLFLLDYLHHYTDTLWFPLILKKKSYPDPFSLSNHCPKSLLPFIENLSKCFCIAVSNHSSEIGRREWVGWLIMSYKLKKMENQSQGGLGRMHVNGFLGMGSKSLDLDVLR